MKKPSKNFSQFTLATILSILFFICILLVFKSTDNANVQNSTPTNENRFPDY